MRRSPLITRGRLIAVAGIVVVALLGIWLVNGALVTRTAAVLAAVQSGPASFRFSPEPLRLPPQTPISLTFTNDTDAPHTLILLAPIAVQTTAALNSGGSARLDFVTPERGTYRFVCNVHEGMTGTVVVE